MILRLGFLLLTFSETQSVVAQSSCEAELMSTNTGAVELTFLAHLLEEIG